MLSPQGLECIATDGANDCFIIRVLVYNIGEVQVNLPAFTGEGIFYGFYLYRYFFSNGVTLEETMP
jgi:hypothetical protein